LYSESDRRAMGPSGLLRQWDRT